MLFVPRLRYANVDRKSTRLNSSHLVISYAVFCLKKKKISPVSVVHSPTSSNNHLTLHFFRHYDYTDNTYDPISDSHILNSYTIITSLLYSCSLSHVRIRLVLSMMGVCAGVANCR